MSVDQPGQDRCRPAVDAPASRRHLPVGARDQTVLDENDLSSSIRSPSKIRSARSAILIMIGSLSRVSCTAETLALAAVPAAHEPADSAGGTGTARVRARLVGVAAFAYTGLMVTVTVQAFRGQALIHPDGRTLRLAAGFRRYELRRAVAVVVAAARRVGD